MRTQCVPGPLIALWEGPGYEATRKGWQHSTTVPEAGSELTVSRYAQCVPGPLIALWEGPGYEATRKGWQHSTIVPEAGSELTVSRYAR